VNPQSLAAVRSMEYVAIHTEEDAQSVVLSLQSDGVTRLCFRFGLAPIVVFDWRNLRVKRHMKIVNEITSKQGEPFDAPSLCSL
jgi:hypothetical protein